MPCGRGLLAIVSVVALCGCGGTHDPATTETTTPPARHAAVVERHARPAAVARAFLRAHGLI